MTLYVIHNWANLFETAETRKLDTLKWFPSPNKLDGLGYRLMIQERDRAELFAIWTILKSIASRTTPKHRRGYLERDERPLTAAALSAMSGFPAPLFERAFTFFSSPEIAWLRAEDAQTASATPPPMSDHGSAGRPASVPARPAETSAEGKGREGTEGKEWNWPAGAGEEFRKLFGRWMEFRRGLGKKPKDWHAMFQEQLDWLGLQPAGIRSEIISASIRNGWQGLFEPKHQHNSHVPPSKRGDMRLTQEQLDSLPISEA